MCFSRVLNLPTMLDENQATSPSTGRRPRSRNLAPPGQNRLKQIPFYVICRYWNFTPFVFFNQLDGRHSPAVTCWASDLWSLVRTHSGTSFVINFASLSPASAWPSFKPKQCAQKRPKTPSFIFNQLLSLINGMSSVAIFGPNFSRHAMLKHLQINSTDCSLQIKYLWVFLMTSSHFCINNHGKIFFLIIYSW